MGTSIELTVHRVEAPPHAACPGMHITTNAMSELVLQTRRLLARRIGPTDVEPMLGVYGDPEVVRWVGDGKALGRAQCEKWVEVTQANYASRGYGMFALEARESGAIVGFCGLVHPGGQAEAEVKYAFHRSCWGQGLATEAVSALLPYGASRFGLTEIIATTAPENAASHRVLLKAGMRRGALRREDDGSLTQLFAWRPAAGGQRDMR